jgi:hypothetical protein
MKKVKTEDGTYLGRSCKGCVFKDDHWGGRYCESGRREVFTERGEVLDENVISRFCNMYRDEEWYSKKAEIVLQHGGYLPSEERFVNEAREEVETKFSIVLEATLLEEESLKALVECITDLSYHKRKFNVVISGNMGGNVERMVHYTNILKQCDILAILVLHNPENEDVKSRDRDIYSKCIGSDYIITITDPKMDKLHYDFLHSLDNIINDDMEKILYFFINGGIHVSSFKVVNTLYLKYNSYSEMIGNMMEELRDSSMYKIL